MARYLFASQNKRQKEKQKQKKEKGLTSIGPNSPRQPGPGAALSSSSRQAGCCRRGEHADDAQPPPASPEPHSRVWTLPGAIPILFPSPALSFLPPFLVFAVVREAAGAHRRGRRGHRALEPHPASPSGSSSSPSSSRRRWSTNSSPSRRIRPRALAGTAIDPRRFLHRRDLPASIDHPVEFLELW